jgi:hypothetical protein
MRRTVLLCCFALLVVSTSASAGVPMEATCTLTNLTLGVGLCQAAIRLHEGQVALMGRAYRDAGGFAVFTPAQTNSKLTLTLLP